jgi:hypothetical protein
MSLFDRLYGKKIAATPASEPRPFRPSQTIKLGNGNISEVYEKEC